VGFDGDRVTLKANAHNHPSATTNRVLVAEYIKKELDLGRLVGRAGYNRSK
jgi:hypothetical protein